MDENTVGEAMSSVTDASAREGDQVRAPSSHVWSSLPEAALVIAGLGAVAVMLDFAFQYGQALFYGYPAELVRVSPEWTVYVCFLLGATLAVLWFLNRAAGAAGMVVGVAAAGRRPSLKRTLRWLAASVVALLLSFAWLVTSLIRLDTPGQWLWGSLLTLLGCVSLATSGVSLRIKLSASIASLLALVVVSVTLGYVVVARADSHWRVVGTNMLILAIDRDGPKYVVAPYDAATRSIQPHYSVLASAETSPVAIENVDTGVLFPPVRP